MINNVVLVGRLTKDVELKYTPSGVPMARFTVAVNRTFTGSNGQREADFITCLAWRKQAENLANFMKKGSLIGVQGRIQTGSFEGQDGKRVYTTDVVADSIQFLEPRSSGRNQEESSNGYNPPPPPQTTYQSSGQNGSGGYGGASTYTPPSSPPANDYGFGGGTGEDPFSQSKGPIEVKEDDLPF